MLFLTVNIMACRRRQLWPRPEWTAGQLKRLLEMVGSHSPAQGLKELVSAVIHMLNMQRPVVYALDDGKRVILNSTGVVLTKQGDLWMNLKQGEYHPAGKKAGRLTCNQVFEVFQQRGLQLPKHDAWAENNLITQANEIQRLQTELQNVRHNRTRLQEGAKRVSDLEAQLVFAQQEITSQRDQMAACQREIQTLRAQVNQTRGRLNSENWQTELSNLQQAKQELAACQLRLRKFQNGV